MPKALEVSSLHLWKQKNTWNWALTSLLLGVWNKRHMIAVSRILHNCKSVEVDSFRVQKEVENYTLSFPVS